ncbi:MAG: aminotransferase class III-fold pyridoxal phosphate-dependent enzyme, partial [Candidatus Regiella insecticola]|nr:aminotransferase class III-fold pyridoxal phosphate-dependent enzyme [Candidatus Regiella insecticola]
LYQGYIIENLFASVPQCQVNSGQDDKKLFDHWREDDIIEFRTLIEQHASEIAAVILEPIVQGAGGMRFYHPNYLKQVRALCDKYNI